MCSIIKQTLFSLLLAALVSLPLFSQPGGNASASASSTATGTGTVRIGYYENEVFQEGASANTPKTGYAYEYYRKLSEYTGWQYEYIYGDFNTLYHMFLNGDIDMIAGLAYLEEREQLMYYPDLPMGSTNYYLIKKDSAVDITATPSSLSGKRIGTMNGAMETILADWLEENGVKAEIIVFPSYDDLFLAFDYRTVDVVLTEGTGTYGRKDCDAFASAGKSDFYLCVSRKRPDLLSVLNDVQFQLNTDEPDYLIQLNTKYYPKSISSRAFSATEIEWLNSHRELKIAYMNNYLPYCDTDSNGNPTGAFTEIVSEMLHRLDLDSRLTVSYTGYDSFDGMLEVLHSGKADVIFPVGGSLYYMEECGINQTEPVVRSSVGIVRKKGISNNSQTIFAVNRNNRMQEYYVRSNFPSAGIILFNSIEDCLEAVQRGTADCTSVNGLRVNALLKNTRYKDLDFYPASENDVRAFGVGIGNEALLKLINRGIKSLDSQYIMNLAYQYTDELYNYTAGDFIGEHLVMISTLFIVSIALALALILRDNRKKHQYLQNETKKNQELERAKRSQEVQLKKIENLVAQLRDVQKNNEKYIADMIRFASTEDDADKVLIQLLKYIGNSTGSDRVYIFEENQNGNFDNTYEWCRIGVEPEKDMLQDVPCEGLLDEWMKKFQENGCLIIPAIEEYRKVNKAIYDILAMQSITSLVAVPIYQNSRIIGFLGVDNPPVESVDKVSEMFNLVEFIFAMMFRIRNKTRDIQDNALHDQLTGCRNRKGLKLAYDGAFNPEKSCMVVACDMNGLKQVNDSQGHEAGDNFICRTAETLSDIFGKDNIYRMGGDEFLAVLFDIPEEEYRRLVDMCNLQIGSTASIGTIYRSTMDVSFNDLVKEADMRMYAAKDKFYQDKRKYR